MKDKSLPFGTPTLLVGVLLIGALAHLMVILLIPHFAGKNAYTLLSPYNDHPGIHLLAAPQSGQANPLGLDSAMANGVCFYDLKAGAQQILARIENSPLMLFSFHDQFGQIYYSFNDKIAVHGDIHVELFTRSQLDVLEAQEDEDLSQSDLRLVAPSEKGFVLFRTLVEQSGDQPQAEDLIRSIDCSERGSSHHVSP